MKTGILLHLYREAVAVIVHKRPAPLSAVQVDSLHFTALLPSAPRILINVEMEDSGVIAEGRCDCAFTRAGLTTVIHDIASFGKLTGQGVTLVGTDVVSVLEQRLPALLGGRVGDFQLVEREGGGETLIVLYVSPRRSGLRRSGATVLSRGASTRVGRRLRRRIVDARRRDSRGRRRALGWSDGEGASAPPARLAGAARSPVTALTSPATLRRRAMAGAA